MKRMLLFAAYTYLTMLFFQMCSCFSRSAIILNFGLLSFSCVLFCYSVSEALSYFLFPPPPLFIAFPCDYIWNQLCLFAQMTENIRPQSNNNKVHPIHWKEGYKWKVLPSEFKCAVKGHPSHFRWEEYIKRNSQLTLNTNKCIWNRGVKQQILSFIL